LSIHSQVPENKRLDSDSLLAYNVSLQLETQIPARHQASFSNDLKPQSPNLGASGHLILLPTPRQADAAVLHHFLFLEKTAIFYAWSVRKLTEHVSNGSWPADCSTWTANIISSPVEESSWSVILVTSSAIFLTGDAIYVTYPVHLVTVPANKITPPAKNIAEDVIILTGYGDKVSGHAKAATGTVIFIAGYKWLAFNQMPEK
jgi:hypothetical protein